MSAAKHTKGPWHAYYPQSSPARLASGLFHIDGGGPKSPLVAATPYKGDGHELWANAQLIAAAPELLDALKAARDLLASLPPEIEQLETMAAEDTACQIQEAIAKAEGGES